MEELDPIQADLLGRLRVQLVRVYRNGPRFFVAQVRRDNQEFILKSLKGNDRWEGFRSGKHYASADRLINEISILGALHENRQRLRGDIPEIVDASTEDEVWVLRKMSPGTTMAEGDSPFIYAEKFYNDANWMAALDFVLSLQEASQMIRLSFQPRLADADYTTLAAKLAAVRLSQPSPYVQPYAAMIRTWMSGRDLLHDAHRDVISHGEVYPPHILMHDEVATIIDWENANISNQMQDLVAMWIRGYDRPQWQDQFVRELHGRRVLGSQESQDVWDTTVVLACVGNLNYVHWSQYEDAATKEAIRTSLVGHLELLLKPSHSGSL